ncbi:MAG TPA: ATP-binding protein [Clostridiales bacterium]|jgi:anti-sigma regulatory factor (Ser/Thr protein kinase)|nr:ATP-binding protein [Clostridiales bacterium]
MSVKLNFKIDGNDFTRAGEASGEVKRVLKELGLSSDVIRNVSISLYEGEINMYLHANGGEIDVEVSPDVITMVLADKGPGIADISLAMKEGYSTANDSIRSLGFGAGMGLPNIKKYSDEMEIETELGVGTTIRLKVYVK